VVKADFYGLFKPAYASVFTKNTIEAAFEATGIWPKDQTVVTKKFKYTTPPLQTGNMDASHLSPADWRRTEQLLKRLPDVNNDELVKKLQGAIHRASTQSKLLQHENEELLTSFDTKNKRTAHGRRLLLGGSKQKPTDAVFYSPGTLKQARALQAEKDAAKTAKKAASAIKRELTKA
jgi:hypothetical protein